MSPVFSGPRGTSRPGLRGSGRPASPPAPVPAPHMPGCRRNRALAPADTARNSSTRARATARPAAPASGRKGIVPAAPRRSLLRSPAHRRPRQALGAAVSTCAMARGAHGAQPQVPLRVPPSVRSPQVARVRLPARARGQLRVLCAWVSPGRHPPRRGKPSVRRAPRGRGRPAFTTPPAPTPAPTPPTPTSPRPRLAPRPGPRPTARPRADAPLPALPAPAPSPAHSPAHTPAWVLSPGAPPTHPRLPVRAPGSSPAQSPRSRATRVTKGRGTRAPAPHPLLRQSFVTPDPTPPSSYGGGRGSLSGQPCCHPAVQMGKLRSGWEQRP